MRRWSPSLVLDSDDVCSACVRRFQKWNAAEAVVSQIFVARVGRRRRLGLQPKPSDRVDLSCLLPREAPLREIVR
jgi:hypothetical protein